MVTEQVPVPLQAPPQPEKVAFPLDLAVSVTTVPPEKFALQALPQPIPDGVLLTMPGPLSATLSV